jgi:hypothetical protein
MGCLLVGKESDISILRSGSYTKTLASIFALYDVRFSGS